MCVNPWWFQHCGWQRSILVAREKKVPLLWALRCPQFSLSFPTDHISSVWLCGKRWSMPMWKGILPCSSLSSGLFTVIPCYTVILLYSSLDGGLQPFAGDLPSEAPGFHEAYGLLLPCAVKERCLGAIKMAGKDSCFTFWTSQFLMNKSLPSLEI